MNSEVKTQWTDALRGEEFAQDQAYLRTPDGYCCLGVLCELAARAGVVNAVLEDSGKSYRYSSGNGGSRYYLPRDVMTWAGLSNDNPTVPVEVHYGDETVTENKNLSSLNDEGSTFDEIAELIDEHL